MGTLTRDLRLAIRTLFRNPSFTFVAIIALAVGIGANSAIFSVVNAVLLRPLPYDEPNRLVRLWEKRSELPKGRISLADFNDWKSQNHAFEEIAAYQIGDYSLTGNGDPEQVQGASVSANLFSVLRAQPELGRVFLPEEDKPGATPVVILSSQLWTRRYGADTGLIGRTININNRGYTVAGILPGNFSFPNRRVELWIPLAINPNSPMAGRGMHYLDAIGRLKSTTSLRQAQSEMDTVATRLEQQYPADNKGHGINLLSLQDATTGDFRSNLLMIFSVVGLVLLIACANVANLLLARATARQKELALRTALGAKRGHIIRQLLTENMLLSLLGGSLGLILAFFGIRLLLSFNSGNIARIEGTRLDGSVLAFTFLITLATTFIFGLVPALHSSKANINELLKTGGAGGATSLKGDRLRSMFVVIEVALSLVLLIGAGLMIKSFSRVQSVSPGFNTQNVLTATINLPRSKYPTNQATAFVQRVIAGIQSRPQVESAGAVTHLPLAGNGPTFNFDIEGRPPAPPGEEFKAQMRCATSDYFKALGIAFLDGRQFTARDSNTAPNVLIIDDVMAKRYWPDESALGKHLSLDKTDDGQPIWREIVGVVRGVRHSGLEFEPEPQMYTPYEQFSMPFITLVIHTRTDPVSFTADLRHEVASVDKDQPISNIRTMDQVVSESVAPRQFNMILLSLFAGVALLLAATGIYGVISYSVTQRTREIGIRLALGAQKARVVRLIAFRGLLLTAIGIAVGLGTSLGVTRLASSLLYGVSTTDPYVFGGVSVFIFAIALVASYVPALKAAMVDPLIALRSE